MSFKELSEFSLFTLSGVPVTLASLCICVLTFIILVLVSRVIRKAVEKALVQRGRSRGVSKSIGKIVWYLCLFFSAFVALDTLGFQLTALLAGSAVILMGIGFGLQNIAQNFISGLIVLIERPVQVGDFIHLGKFKGWITNIGLRGTSVVTRDEITIIIPNSELISKQVIKSSSNKEMIRISVDVGVEYKSDIKVVENSLLEAAMSIPTILKQPTPEVFFVAFADSSINFKLTCWIGDPSEDDRITSNLRFRINEVFQKNEVAMAFPHRQLIMDSPSRSASQL